MNWNVFWGMFLLAYAVACWIISYFLCIRKVNKGKRCSAYIKGKVIRYSHAEYTKIHLPVVEYQVDGRVYRITGPKFRSVSYISVNTPFGEPGTQIESNINTRWDLPDRLKLKIRRNSLWSETSSPLYALYPTGSDADVYYNPKKPKEAFVQRFEGVSTWLMGLLLFFSIAITVGALICFFGPEIVMQ